MSPRTGPQHIENATAQKQQKTFPTLRGLSAVKRGTSEHEFRNPRFREAEQRLGSGR